MTVDELGPFDSVLDVGGNVGDTAEMFRRLWPDATITSFEPLPGAYRANVKRSDYRWQVEPFAVSDRDGHAVLRECVNQHSASTMQQVGTVRAERFGIHDSWRDHRVATVTLDTYAREHPFAVTGRLLVKVDVEGHELHVLRGGAATLNAADCVIVECQQADTFVGAPTPRQVDGELRARGLRFAGVVGVQLAPDGEPVQFDGVWLR